MSRFPIVIADDHAVLRESLRLLINSQFDLFVAGEASNGKDAIAICVDSKAAVISLDLSMPGSHQIRTIERIRSASPNTRILVLSMHDTPEFVRSALAAGAMGYIIKTSPITTYLEGIRNVAVSKLFVDPHILQTLDVTLTDEIKSASMLSQREREVLLYLANGLTNLEISNRLFVSEKTIETYRSRIRQKTGLKTRADFVCFGNSLYGEQEEILK